MKSRESISNVNLCIEVAWVNFITNSSKSMVHKPRLILKSREFILTVNQAHIMLWRHCFDVALVKLNYKVDHYLNTFVLNCFGVLNQGHAILCILHLLKYCELIFIVNCVDSLWVLSYTSPVWCKLGDFGHGKMLNS